jgi:poly(A) polymerase
MSNLKVQQLVRRLRQNGYSAYLVGGCVRDYLLGLPPKDFDVATSAHPKEILALFPAAELVGAHFGVVLVDGMEVATYRSDGAYSDGRRPDSVVFQRTPKEDVSRRDFTINGLLWDPESNQIIDFVNGVADMASRTIRVIGDAQQRFSEDYLRLLRAVRFAARLSFAIEPETSNAIRQHASKIQFVAKERVREELNRMLTDGQAAVATRLLTELGLAKQLFAQWPDDRHSRANQLESQWTFFDRLPRSARTLALGWALMFQTYLTDANASKVMSDLRFGTALTRRIQDLLRLLADFANFSDKTLAEKKRLVRRPEWSEVLQLEQIQTLQSSRELRQHNWRLAKRFAERQASEQLFPKPLIDGNGLQAKGFLAGPELGKLLQEIEEGQLNQTILTLDDVEAFLQAKRPVKAV